MSSLPRVTESVQTLRQLRLNTTDPVSRTRLDLLLLIRGRRARSIPQLAAQTGMDGTEVSTLLGLYQAGGVDQLLRAGSLPSAGAPGGPGPMSVPTQVPRFKCTHYVGNYLELADVAVASIYELLKSQRTFTLRSGATVGDAFNLSTYTIAKSWADGTNTDSLSKIDDNNVGTFMVFWQTLYRFLQTKTGDLDTTRAGLMWVHTALSNAVNQPSTYYPVLTQWQTNLLVDWYSLSQSLPGFADQFTIDDLLKLLSAIKSLGDLLDQIFAYSFADLENIEQELPNLPLVDETYLRLSGVIEIHLPEDSDDFLTWSFGDTLWPRRFFPSRSTK